MLNTEYFYYLPDCKMQHIFILSFARFHVVSWKRFTDNHLKMFLCCFSYFIQGTLKFYFNCYTVGIWNPTFKFWSFDDRNSNSPVFKGFSYIAMVTTIPKPESWAAILVEYGMINYFSNYHIFNLTFYEAYFILNKLQCES